MTLIVRRAKRWDLSALQSAAWWKARFDAATAAQSAAALALWDTNKGIDIYNGSYYIAALAMMYLATGESGYLDYFWTYHNAKVGHAAFCDTLVGTNFTESDKKGWRAETSSGRTLEYQYPLDESISWRHVAWMLAIMKAKDTHINEEPYATYWSDGLAFCEDHIWDKWRSRSITTNIYRSRTHMASHWACIAYYLARVTSSATIKQQCLDIWGDIHHKGMSNYSGYNQAYAAIMDNFHVAATYTDLTRVAPFDWSDQWQSEAGAWNEATTPKQDVGHGVNLYHYLALMGFAKRVPRSKMDRLASAMVRWWDNPGGNWWDFVDATNDSPDAGETGWISDGGGLVSAWEPAILKRMETHTVGQGWNLYASGTLACVLLQTVDPPAGRLWTPSDLPSLSLWLDAMDSSTITLNGATVAQWDDKSGTGNHMTQGTAANQPTYNPTGFNSLPTLVFDGSNDFLGNSTPVNLNSSGDFFYAAVFSITIPTNWAMIMGGRPAFNNFFGSNGGMPILQIMSTSSQIGIHNADILDVRIKVDVTSVTGNRIATAGRTGGTLGNGGTVTISATGNSQPTYTTTGTQTWNSAVNQVFQIGGRQQGATGYYNGQICECVALGANASTQDRQRVEGYFAHKWQLQASLPSDHPYRHFPPRV